MGGGRSAISGRSHERGLENELTRGRGSSGTLENVDRTTGKTEGLLEEQTLMVFGVLPVWSLNAVTEMPILS